MSKKNQSGRNNKKVNQFRHSRLTTIEQMSDDELLEEKRVLEAEISAAHDRLGKLENELFYRKYPECPRPW